MIELVMVIIIVGVLAAVAVPKFIAMGRDARLVSLRTLASALRSTAENVHALCSMTAGCDYGNASQTLQIAGRSAWVNYGWLDSGDNLEGNQIDAWVTHTGFTTTIPTPSNTLFTLDGSPDPSNCSVNYFDAYHRGPAAGILIVSTTAGC